MAPAKRNTINHGFLFGFWGSFCFIVCFLSFFIKNPPSYQHYSCNCYGSFLNIISCSSFLHDNDDVDEADDDDDDDDERGNECISIVRELSETMIYAEATLQSCD